MMSKEGHVVVLIGSPKASKSTSESLSNYLIKQLTSRGARTQKIQISKSLKSDEKRENLLLAVEKASTVVIVSPLYVDCLPYPVTKAFELINEYRQRKGLGKSQRLVAILNCGFPEAHQNDTALEICRLFAREAGFEWSGGLALGMGGTIDGCAVEKLGGMFRSVKSALELTAVAIIEDKAVPQEAVELMAKPFVPKWLYIQLVDIGWSNASKRYGTSNNLLARPYEC